MDISMKQSMVIISICNAALIFQWARQFGASLPVTLELVWMRVPRNLRAYAKG